MRAQTPYAYDTGVTLRSLCAPAIDVRVFPGHTGGDSVVFIPDANVVFTGDLFWRNTLPNLIDATTSSWIATLEAVATTASDATFVPGHGDVGNAADAQAFRGYLAYLRERTALAVKDGKTGHALVAAVLPAITERYWQMGLSPGNSRSPTSPTRQPKSGGRQKNPPTG